MPKDELDGVAAEEVPRQDRTRFLEHVQARRVAHGHNHGLSLEPAPRLARQLGHQFLQARVSEGPLGNGPFLHGGCNRGGYLQQEECLVGPPEDKDVIIAHVAPVDFLGLIEDFAETIDLSIR